MIYCYDTEFLEDGETIELISIGIVCEDGREYYAVNSDMDEDRIKYDDWICQNVIQHLPLRHGVSRLPSNTGWMWGLDMSSAHVKPKWVIANEVRDFLLSKEAPELWAYYAAYDHVALAQLWGRMVDLPEGIPMFTHDLKQEMDRLGASVDGPEDEHNALADARWNMDLLRALRGGA